jgi:hypothetical protein
VFDRFTLTGRTAPLDELMATNPQTDPVAIDRASAGRRRDELPRGRDVVTFPAAPSGR